VDVENTRLDIVYLSLSEHPLFFLSSKYLESAQSGFHGLYEYDNACGRVRAAERPLCALIAALHTPGVKEPSRLYYLKI